jgi:putative flippase GtrA
MKTNLMLLERFQILKEGFLYGLIGGFAATVDALLYIFLTRIFHLNSFTANFISINIGITISFFLNSFYNFRLTDNLKKRAIRFFCVGYLGLVLSMVILFLGTNVFKLNDLLIKILSVFIVAAFQFVLNKLITFQKEVL